MRVAPVPLPSECAGQQARTLASSCPPLRLEQQPAPQQLCNLACGCLLCLLPGVRLQVKRMAGATPANRKRAVVWASPPCTEYTTLKRGRPRNLAAADACVAAIARIAADLDAAMVRACATGWQQAWVCWHDDAACA